MQVVGDLKGKFGMPAEDELGADWGTIPRQMAKVCAREW